MAITLVGEVATDADTAADFTTLNGGANISTDDDSVEGTGAVGDKMSGTNELLASNALTSTYNFSSTHAGDHIIGWFNTKTPINATTGLGVYVGNGTDSGTWYVIPTVFYKGGFITKVIDPTRDFDENSGWTAAGNPAQLDDVSEMGGEFYMTTTIMGNFNNSQVDQFTVGTGIRADAGTVPSPNTFEAVRVVDEDTNFWGWWSSTQGAFIGKGKLYIGPASGSATSVFTDTAFTVIFADELVAQGFYEITMRGAGTDTTWDLASISAANATNVTSRWSIAVESDTSSFTDTNGVWSGSDVITLNANSTLTGTTIIDGISMIQNGATLDGVTVLSAFTGDGVAYIQSDDPGLIDDCTFEHSDGHAIEMTATGTYAMDGNTFTNYGVAESNDAAIYNNSGGLVTLNISNGASPTIRNESPSTTDVIQSVDIDFHVEDASGNNIQFAQVYIQKSTPTPQFSGIGNNAGDGDIVLTSAVDSDIPTSGWAIVYDKSENATQPYRYASVSGSTLTLRTTFPAVPTATTSQGTSTQLIDSAADFGGADDIKEGDTIRNNDDGSWAVVDQIVSTTELKTSPLRGGTDNVWGTVGDPTHDYSVHDLATTLLQNVDTVDIPMANEQTDSNGDIPSVSFNFGSPTPVVIRVRSNEGATKYIPFVTAATLTGAFSGTAVLQEDTVAT